MILAETLLRWSNRDLPSWPQGLGLFVLLLFVLPRCCLQRPWSACFGLRHCAITAFLQIPKGRQTPDQPYFNWLPQIAAA